jgi:hypothetical protein
VNEERSVEGLVGFGRRNGLALVPHVHTHKTLEALNKELADRREVDLCRAFRSTAGSTRALLADG